ncbi:helix-turn-helix domain-containing protein [Staphylococcus xylosus]|uniref:helix-turn-helix domain-containing protein n=2 Tax=Staphylococcus TaxID=1279 RepID=UPI0036AF683E
MGKLKKGDKSPFLSYFYIKRRVSFDVCFWYNISMENYKNNDYIFDKKQLIKHAKTVLRSKKLSGVELSKEVGIHVQQIYGYKSGKRNIQEAQLETLYKFEKVYQENEAFKSARKGENRK